MDAAQRQAERRAKLLDAGLEVFGTRGFAVSTVKDVCTEARLTERYFYESFANREELFAAVYQRCVQVLRERLAGALSRPQAVQTLTRLALGMLYTELRDDPRIARVLFLDVLSAHGDMDKHSLAALQGFTDLLQGYLEQVYPDIDRAALNPTLISTGLVGAVVLLVTRWVITGFRESIDEMVRNTGVLFEALASHVADRGPDSPPR